MHWGEVIAYFPAEGESSTLVQPVAAADRVDQPLSLPLRFLGVGFYGVRDVLASIFICPGTNLMKKGAKYPVQMCPYV